MYRVFIKSTPYSCQILIKLKCSPEISKNSHIRNFMKIRPVGAVLFHADGQTDTGVTKLIVAFRNSANARRKGDLQKFRRLS